MLLTVFLSVAVLPELSFWLTFSRLQLSAFFVVPLVVGLDAIGSIMRWSNFQAKLTEAIVYILFLAVLFTAAQQNFHPGARAPHLYPCRVAIELSTAARHNQASTRFREHLSR